MRTGDVPAFTISVGLADALAGGSHAEVIRDADEAMFRAKQAGRDRVVVASDPGWSVPSDTVEPPDDSRQPLRAVTPSAGT